MKKVILWFLLSQAVFLCYSCKVIRKDVYISNRKKLERISQTAEYVKNLTIVNYVDTVFPSETLSKFKNLKKLNIFWFNKNWKCKNCELPIIRIDTARLSKLLNLEDLNLYYFNFKSFPKEIYLLKNLKRLGIGGAFIDSIPDDIGKLANLEYLELRLNYLKTLPDSIVQLKKLKTLDVDNNPFRQFPDAVLKHSSLQTFSIADGEGSSKEWNRKEPQYYFRDTEIEYEFDILSNLEKLKELLSRDQIKKVRITAHSERERDFIKEHLTESSLKKLAIQVVYK